MSSGSLDEVPSLRQNRDFTLLWCGQAASALGSSASGLAYPLLILAVSGSAVAAGAVGTAAGVVQIVFRIPGGALADRWNRRTLMLACDALRIILLTGLGVLVLTDHASIATIAAIAVANALLGVTFEPASMAAVSQLVPARQLPQAFGANEARSFTAGMAGPPLGGALFGLARAAPFIFDAVTYLVSLLTLLPIRRPLQGVRDPGPRISLLRQIGQGLAYVRASRFLRAVIAVYAFVDFAFTAALFAVVVILNQAGSSPSTVGLAQGVIAAGGVLGALAAARIQLLLPFRKLIITAVAILTGCLAASAVLSGQLVMALPMTVALFLAPALNAAIFSQLAITTPEHLQGRVISVVISSVGIVEAAAPLTAGLLITHQGGRAALTATAISAAAALSIALRTGGLAHTR
ncbi:MAG: MFS transporter [Actinomycetota bacterium]|nr:MFS transporter [Actinomycetota bacterium]